MAYNPSRRMVLRGTGVALALPWLESLAPRLARAQAASTRRTFVAMYFPCGVGQYWKPATAGVGDAWALSPILQPLAPVKSHVTVLGSVGNYGPFGGNVQPSHSNLTGAFLTCRAPKYSFAAPSPEGGISVDQVIANALGRQTPLQSLQVGLTTTLSSPDGLPAQFSRSISWKSPTEPLYKLVNPQAVFDRLVSGNPSQGPLKADAFSLARRAANKSVLDHVAGHAASVRGRLGRGDQGRLDEFLASVRSLEKRVAESRSTCSAFDRPTKPVVEASSQRELPADYNRDDHANLMIDLMVMALSCDITRVASFMFEDSRSDFVHSFLKLRRFGPPTMPVPPTDPPETVGSLVGYVNSSDASDGWATIHQWMMEKVARLATKLQAIQDGAGTMLDNATIFVGSEMDGLRHDGLRLPLLFVGRGGGRLKTNQFIDFATTARKAERLANVYLTFIRHVFGLPNLTFGGDSPPRIPTTPSNDYGGGTAVIPELLQS